MPANTTLSVPAFPATIRFALKSGSEDTVSVPSSSPRVTVRLFHGSKKVVLGKVGEALGYGSRDPVADQIVVLQYGLVAGAAEVDDQIVDVAAGGVDRIESW